MNKFSLTIIVLFLLTTATVLLLWFNLWSNQNTVHPVPLNTQFTLIDGTKTELHKFSGNPLLVTFWATSCVTCVKEIPHLITLYESFHKDGFEIIAVAMQYNPPNQVLNMRDQKNIPYPIAIDITGNTAGSFGDILRTPTSFLIAADSSVAKKIIGKINMDELRNMVIAMLPQKTLQP